MKQTILRLNKKIQKKRVDNYYKSILHQGQTYHSRIFNYILVRLLILVGAFLIFFYISDGQGIYVSFITGLSVLVIYQLVSGVIEEKKLNTTILEVNRRIADEEFWKKVKNLDKEAFVVYIKDILEKLPGFSEVKITSSLESEGISILCEYRNTPMAVGCYVYTGEDVVEAKEARLLSRTMSNRKYQNAIIISTTDFRDDTKAFCQVIKDKRKIKLIGKNMLLQMAKEAGKYPRDEEIRDIILKKIEHKERVWRDAQHKLLAKPRIMPYFIYGSVLIFSSTFLNFGGKYLYYSCALALYALGTIAFVVNVFHKQKTTASNSWQDLM